MNKLASRYFRLNNIYKIIDKKRNSITFVMNKAQKKVHEIKKNNLRLAILKGRQFGITTYKCIAGLDKALWFKNQKVVITAHTQQKQTEIFQIVKYAYDTMPDIISCDGLSIVKPKAKYDTKNELFFEENNSSIRVTLDSRSTTVSSLHITELAFRDGADDMMTGTLPSVPIDAEISIETTSNGVSGVGKYFYDFWNTENNFEKLFLGWYDHDEYEIECPEGYVFEQKVESYRKYLHEYSKERQDRKLYWYTIQKRDLKGKVVQEYPTYPEEAFITTGNSVFDNNKLSHLQSIDLYYDEDEKFKDLRIYRNPCPCMVAIDTAGGYQKGDYSCIIGRDENYGLVFHFYAKVNSDILIEVVKIIDELGYFGVIAPEINATSGGEFISLLKNQELNNFKIYIRENSSDDINESGSTKYGFLTNSRTRNEILDNFERIVENGEVTEFDSRQLREMKNFFVDNSGKRIATQDSHDDSILADSICCKLLENGVVYRVSTHIIKEKLL